MIGQIRCYFPKSRRGVLQTGAGRELIFTVPEGIADLEGGDNVEFELGSNGQWPALTITAHRRWVDTLNQEHRSLVNQFHATIQIHS